MAAAAAAADRYGTYEASSAIYGTQRMWLTEAQRWSPWICHTDLSLDAGRPPMARHNHETVYGLISERSIAMTDTTDLAIRPLTAAERNRCNQTHEDICVFVSWAIMAASISGTLLLAATGGSLGVAGTVAAALTVGSASR